MDKGLGPTDPKTQKKYAPLKEHWQKSIESAASIIHQEITGKIIKHYFKWAKDSTEEGIQIYKNVKASPNFISTKGVGIIEATPEKVLAFLLTHSRAEWDKMCLSQTRIERVDDFTEVLCDVYKGQKCLIREQRDLCYLLRVYTFDTNQKKLSMDAPLKVTPLTTGYLVAAVSVSHPDCPPATDMARADLVNTGWIIVPIVQNQNIVGSQVTYVVNVDLKIPYIPEILFRTIALSQPKKIILLRNAVSKALEKRKKSIEKKSEVFEEFVKMFENEEEALSFFLDKYRISSQTSRKLALQRTLHRFSLSNTPHTASPMKGLRSNSSGSCEILVPKELFQDEKKSEDQPRIRVQFGSANFQGQRSSMEDRHLIVERNGVYLFAIFDGHYGEVASVFCYDHFADEFFAQLQKLPHDPKQALQMTFDQIEKKFLEYANSLGSEAGTTASVIVIAGKSATDVQLISGNIGDSEAILCSRQNQKEKPPRGFALSTVSEEAFSPLNLVGAEIRSASLTEVHNAAKNPFEEKRVLEAGGGFFHKKLVHPLWNPSVINLGVTRSIGDLYFKSDQYTKNKKTGLSCTPFLRQLSLSANDKFAVMACDGVWDVVSQGSDGLCLLCAQGE